MNKFRVLSIDETDSAALRTYDEFVLSVSTGHLLQSNAWVAVQKSLARRMHRFLLVDSEESTPKSVLAALLIEYEVPGNMKYLYAPCGPVIDPAHVNAEVITEFVQEVRRIARESNAIFLRVDPRLTTGAELLQKLGFLHSSFHIQPTNTRMLSLAQTTDELLAQMKPKTRYNIRLAERKHITVRESTDPASDAVDVFFELMQQTSARDEFRAHSKAYYQTLFSALAPLAQLSIYTAYHGETPVASIMVTFSGRQATYLHGASDYAHRNLMAPYLVQWYAIQEAKKRGCTTYDFWGIAPENATNHAWAGVTRFKEGFGGERVDYIGTFDYVIRPLLYHGYTFAKSVIRK